jgi:hypothetical protein
MRTGAPRTALGYVLVTLLVAAGPAAWLRARYTDPRAWREVGYACLLATVVPALCVVALSSVLLTGFLIASPFLVLAQQPGSGPVALAVGHAPTVGQTVPFAIVGIVLLPLVPYLMTLVAGADAAASRARLADAFEAERRRIERDPHPGDRRRQAGRQAARPDGEHRLLRGGRGACQRRQAQRGDKRHRDRAPAPTPAAPVAAPA